MFVWSFPKLYGYSVSWNNSYINFGAILSLTLMHFISKFLNIYVMSCESILFFQQFIKRGSCIFIHQAEGSFLQCISLLLYFCLGRPYYFNFFKGFLPQILLGSFLNTLTHLKTVSTLVLLEKGVVYQYG